MAEKISIIRIYTHHEAGCIGPMAIRDLRTYADALMGEVAHYRDADKLECDAVVHLRDGRYGLVEIKLGGDVLIKEGVESLTTLANGVTNYGLAEVRYQDGKFIHKSIRSFFSEEGAEKYFTLSLGKEWTGGDVFEDYC